MSRSAKWLVGALVVLAIGFIAVRQIDGVRLLAGAGVVQPWQPPSAPAAPAELRGREPCDVRAPLKQALFGDLHVHSGFSYDARARDVTVTPADAYRFARGEPVGLPPLDETGAPTREVRLARPLDFAMVADHAEWLGETALCTDDASPSFASWPCRSLRNKAFPKALGALPFFAATRSGPDRSATICGPGAADCRDAVGTQWRATQEAAEQFYDRSARCEFTTFVGYEYSRRELGFMTHRNVVFRNEIVPELPLSSIEAPEPEDLWRGLRELCIETDSGCDALAIPHNTNYSSGFAFAPRHRERPAEEQRELASLRAALEPLVEITQHKGDSECRGGLRGVTGTPDEFCDFEKIWAAAPECPQDGPPGEQCVAPLSYARYALARGLADQARLGVNPLKLGFVGSTDTHNGTPGAVEEHENFGARGKLDFRPQQRLKSGGSFGQPGGLTRSKGGLAGVWAEENSREAIFDALARREAFGTSGPRIQPRFFGGWDLPEDICEQPSFAEQGYANGVPMGGNLEAPPASTAGPVFAVQAMRDPGTADHPGGLLQRIQVVKVTAGENGNFHQEIFDVAGGPNTADVDLDTCRPRGTGAASLCATWRDPDFDPDEPAAWYARVLENPSCRWSWWECLRLPVQERPEACAAESFPRTLQERAWTSPIWFEPKPTGHLVRG